MNREEICEAVRNAVTAVRETNPMAPSITNTVTINLVANAQLAVGGSAAMVYLPDEGEDMARIGGAMYINMGTQLPVYAETLSRTARVLHEEGKNWVVDPVGVGHGNLRMELLKQFKASKPSVVRGNASEIIAMANLWGLESGIEQDGVRGVDSTDSVDAARTAANSIARFTGGAVAVSGERDLVTDGTVVVRSEGGSHFMPLITGAGCSLGGVIAVYACCASPFIAALAGTAVYNLAGARAEKKAEGPGSFLMHFIDELYKATAENIAAQPFSVEEV